jgi:hypothetical protein
MQIDRRITNGLAWAGAFLVVGVPTADLLSAQFLGDKASPPPAQIAVVTPQNIAPIPAPRSQRPAEKPVAVANVAPAKPTAVTPAKPSAAGQQRVNELVQSGKPLPSYITEGQASSAQTASVKPAPAAVLPAAPRPAPVAPPQAASATPVVAPQAIAAAPTPAAAPVGPLPDAAPMPGTDPIQTASIAPKEAPTPMPLSMRPRPTAVSVANQQSAFPNEPVFVPPTVEPVRPAEITADELDDWETGPLEDFLARRQGQQQAEMRPEYTEDEEVFFERGQEFQRRDRLVGPQMFYFPQ